MFLFLSNLNQQIVKIDSCMDIILKSIILGARNHNGKKNYTARTHRMTHMTHRIDIEQFCLYFLLSLQFPYKLLDYSG